MNLAICLLMARRFIEKSQIREVVEGYHDLTDAAFERTFERDKDELRRLGVPVETGSNDALFPDEVGYRILRKDFELPPIEFSAAETAALGLAATVWESATQAGQTVSALAKLRAAGVDPDPSRLSVLAPSVGAREPAFAGVWSACAERAPISFGYRGEIRITLLNTDTAHAFVIEPGDRIAQLIVMPVSRARFIPVESLPGSQRGTSGFGSTGIGAAEGVQS